MVSFELKVKDTGMKSRIVLAASLLLVGCASNSGVVPIGSGTFLISKQAATGFPGTGKIKTDALKEAGQYCIAQNKTMEIIQLDESEGPYLIGKYPHVDLKFRCT